MKTTTFQITGMHCASCAIRNERSLKKIAGVKSAAVNFATHSATVEFDEAQATETQLHDAVIKNGNDILFKVTDLSNTVTVVYRGLLPDLFREGQGIVAEGQFRDGVFMASEVLAKHDETYMPPEVADALKKAGQWKPEAK